MNVVGIDVGTTGLKAVAVEPEGRIVRERTVRYPTELAGLGAEQDAPGVVAGGHGGAEVVGGEPRERRGRDVPSPDAGGCGRRRRTARTSPHLDRPQGGSRSEEIAAACQPTRNPPDPYFATAKLLWWMRHRPEELEGARAVLCANGLQIQRLCGQSTSWTSPTLGCSRGGTGGSIRSWSCSAPSTCSRTRGLRFEMAGEVTAEAADATSLPEGTPVAHGGTDAVGAATPKRESSKSTTGSWK